MNQRSTPALTLVSTPGSTHERILDVAHQLMVERGYNGFSFADIAERIDIRKASIHHHFPTKAALGAQVVTRYRAAVRDGAARLDAAVASPRARLQAFADYSARCIEDGSMPFCVCAMLGSETATLPDEIRAEVQGHFNETSGWIAGIIAQGAAAGELSLFASPDLEARMFLSTIHGAMLAARALNRPELFRSVTDEALKRLTPTP